MTRVDRLARRKARLTRRLVRADLRRDERGKPERKRTLLRARLYRVDLLLEREGWFDA